MGGRAEKVVQNSRLHIKRHLEGAGLPLWRLFGSPLPPPPPGLLSPFSQVSSGAANSRRRWVGGRGGGRPGRVVVVGGARVKEVFEYCAMKGTVLQRSSCDIRAALLRDPLACVYRSEWHIPRQLVAQHGLCMPLGSWHSGEEQVML